MAFSPLSLLLSLDKDEKNETLQTIKRRKKIVMTPYVFLQENFYYSAIVCLCVFTYVNDHIRINFYILYKIYICLHKFMYVCA